jgi:hypothetical protein
MCIIWNQINKSQANARLYFREEGSSAIPVGSLLCYEYEKFVCGVSGFLFLIRTCYYHNLNIALNGSKRNLKDIDRNIAWLAAI